MVVRFRAGHLLLAGSLVIGCTLATEGTLKNDGNGGGNGGTSPATGTGGAGTGGAPGAGGTAGETTSSGPSAGGGGDGGDGGDSSTSSSGGGTTTTTSTPTGPEVPCSDGECEAGEVCCHFGGPTNDFCAAPGGCGGNSEMACAGPADCPNQVCCAQWNGFFADWMYSMCKPSCSSSENQFCGGDPASCPQDKVCGPSDNLGLGYGFCG